MTIYLSLIIFQTKLSTYDKKYKNIFTKEKHIGVSTG